ncbi:hypothetical protein ND748_00045 [Frankia sp. AiPs1]|uniref:hypothetical protein n=1 Tax=Frankia sp. AiPs1 TaxID=573493 RepID=UPI0020447844|nr:hypothetical protein [Frankia sp. AiPs1]MCM3920088.1 hypothetical protein [Frankia sp. AiPs1]
MSVVATLDVVELDPHDYRTVLDHMAVETRPSPGIYLHVATRTDNGMRITELWDQEPGFRAFLLDRMIPATQAVRVERETDIAVEPIFNLFAPRLDEIPDLPARPGGVVTTLDVHGLTGEEYRALIDHLDVEKNPDPGIFLHICTPSAIGYRIVELWDAAKHFEAFLQRRLAPATEELRIDRRTDIAVHPITNIFAPRLTELPGLVPSLPGGPRS